MEENGVELATSHRNASNIDEALCFFVEKFYLNYEISYLYIAQFSLGKKKSVMLLCYKKNSSLTSLNNN